MDDEQHDFFRNFKPPNAEQLGLNAQEIGWLGKEVERISMHNNSNNAHASVDALRLAWGVLLLAENLCRRTGARSTEAPARFARSPCLAVRR